MALPDPEARDRTYLVECFGMAGLPEPPSGGSGRTGAFLATLAIADDEQLLVLVRGRDAATAVRRCVAAGLTVDRVVEVTLSPAWRWSNAGSGPRPRARASPR